MRKHLAHTLIALVSLAAVATSAKADSVAQVGTSVRISRATARLIDPQGRPGMSTTGSTTAARPGDILTYIVHFTPVPNGATRGLGGYITVYVPRNTEVVGARIIDGSGATVPPHRGGLASDGCGPRGCTGYGNDSLGAALLEGSLSQLYADTGVFFATDPRTQRIPHGTGADEFVTIFNGITMTPRPTGIPNIGIILGTAGPYYAHNQWDWIQALAFGVGTASGINRNGDGNTPDMYGSGVAGPDTWYPFEASYTGTITEGMTTFDPTQVVASRTTGPWQRIRTLAGEIGRRGNVPPMPDPGVPTRIGIEAIDGTTGLPLGRALYGGAPLPSYDTSMPTAPYTRALRYAVGELVVGEEYLAEFSLRVRDLPLDPVTMSDVVCAEVTGGDASARDSTGSAGGKDNTWRYFLPAPSCVSLALLFDLDVDRLVAVNGDTLTYTLHMQNLATTAHTNVQVHHCFDGGDLMYLSSTPAGTTGAGGCPAGSTDVTWTIPRLDPGATETYTLQFRITGSTRSTVLSRAIFTSDQLPTGFSTVAFTNVDPNLVIVDLSMVATPTSIPSPPGTVDYVATVRNRGPGTGGAISTTIRLPSPFTYVAGSTTVNGAARTANPTITTDPGTGEQILLFTAGPFTLPDLAPAGAAGDTMTLGLRATVPGSTAPGAYRAGIETWYAAGRDVSDARSGLAEVLVGIARSDVPMITSAIIGGATNIRGTTTEADGTIIRVYINGVEVARGTATGGMWSITVPALSANEHVSVSAEASGELESPRSAEVVVPGPASGGTLECADGIDNDGDGLVDLADPDCTSASDLTEAHIPQCADGMDNDGDALVDYGEDPGCRSLVDDDESGPAECSDGIDNDGNGSFDFPDDPGCSSADDVLELDLPACADGIDNDMDGLIDFPFDPGCSASTDGDEAAGSVGVDAGPTIDGGAMPIDGGTMSSDAGLPPMPPDLGGADRPGSGCGCRAAGKPLGGRTSWVWALVAAGLALVRRRR